MAICKDPNDQIERNASLVTNLNDISPDGTLRPSIATTALEEYSRLVSADIELNAQTTVINRFVNQYGQEAFDAGLIAINNTLINREVFQNNLSNYPDLQNRLNQPVPITPIEYANYMDEFLQTPNTVVNLVNSNTLLVQSQLNDFYRNNFTQSAIGSFCSLMPDVFDKIDDFFDAIDDAQKKFQKIEDFINNFSLEDLVNKLTMKNLISKIKEQVSKIIEDTINKVKGIIEDLSFENTIGQIETFINKNIVKKFIELKEQTTSFFSEENVERLKNKVENLFDYAAKVFKDPSLEEIQFLVYRFCSFAAQIESAINLLKKPLDDFVSDYQTTYNTLKSYGLLNTSRAVSEGGAIRYSDEEIRARIDAAIRLAARQSDVPPLNMTIGEARLVQELTWEKLKNNEHPNFRIPFDDPNTSSWKRPKPVGQELHHGWTETTVETRAGLIRLQRLYSEEVGKNVVFKINSGYRNELLNAEVGGVDNSWHIQRKAFDISWDGINLTQMNKVKDIAKTQVGFQEVLVYPDKLYIHIGNIKDSDVLHPE